MIKKKQSTYDHSIHDEDYDRWGDIPGSIQFLPDNKKSERSASTRRQKKDGV